MSSPIQHNNQYTPNTLLYMAFVSQAPREFLNKDPYQHLGPGYYEGSQQNFKKNSCAPFNSTQKRKDMHSTIMPGPGDYKLSRRIGDPSISTYQSRNSILLKIHHEGSQPFLSKEDRFSSHQNSIPGPGECKILKNTDTPETTSLHSSPKRKKQAKLKGNRQKNAPSISKTMILNKKAVAKPSQPFLKDDWHKFEMKMKGTLAGTWAKDKIKRFQKRSYTQIGPGYYDAIQRKGLSKALKQKQSVSFASKAVRTYFDTLLYQTVNKDTMLIRQFNKHKSMSPGPADYKAKPSCFEIDNEDSKYKDKNFGSIRERFHTQPISECADRPFYDTSVAAPSFLKKKVPFNSQSRKTPQQKILMPGPGSYDVKPKQPKRRGKNIQSFGTLKKRDLTEFTEQSDLGPGYYSLEKANDNQTDKKYFFASKLQRFGKQKKNYNTGSYDIETHDISRRLETTMMYRHNLQNINTQLPGFNKSTPRFSHYQPKIQTKAKEENKQLFSVQQENAKIDKEKRSILLQQAKQEIKDSRPCPMGLGGPRFAYPTVSPGVGDYNVRERWNKKSYNVKYKF